MHVTRNLISKGTWLLFGCTLALAGCNKPQTTVPQKGDVPVGVVVVKTQKVFVTVELPGRTSPYQIAEVRPQVGGIVMQRTFREGSDVKAGETLYLIDPALYKAAYDSAQANLSKAEANLTTIRIKAERYNELVKINAISKQDFDDVSAALKQAIADVAANKALVDTAGINLGYTRITSPITGRIGISTVTPGALLVPGQAIALTTVQQLDPIYVDVTQSSDELIRMKHALETGLLKRVGANVARIRLVMDDNSAYAFEGKLKLSDVTVNQGTSTVTLRAEFPNPNHDLLPGMFLHAVLDEGVDEEGILVPQQGVTHNARGIATALVLDPDGKVEQRVLELGEAIGNKWIVKSGLKAGDQLIVDGLQKIKPGSAARAVPIEDATATSPARQ